jgi:NifB/MoaA-like Fe-S oxidoreductase
MKALFFALSMILMITTTFAQSNNSKYEVKGLQRGEKYSYNTVLAHCGRGLEAHSSNYVFHMDDMVLKLYENDKLLCDMGKAYFLKSFDTREGTVYVYQTDEVKIHFTRFKWDEVHITILYGMKTLTFQNDGQVAEK